MSIHVEQSGDGVEVTLTDDLRHRKYSWPVSRISVPIEFTDGPASVEDLTLSSGETNDPVDFQLTDGVWQDGRLIRGRLHLLTDLPSGAIRQFALRATPEATMTTGPATVVIREEGTSIVLTNGLVRIELPAQSRTADSPGGITAPILRFGDRHRWLGRSRWITAEPPERSSVHWPVVGPIVSECVLRYEFSRNRSYQIRVRLSAGMEFFELDEEIEGFAKGEDAALAFDVDGVEFTHQYCANRPAESTRRSYSQYAWEEFGTGSGDAGRLPMKLAPFHNWLTRWRLPAVAFWSEDAKITTGVFITRMERWDDREYAIWNSSDTLCVKFFAHPDRVRWHYPIVAGSRSTAITVYPHDKDIELVERTGFAQAYVDSLRRWHGWLPLDKVKDWHLNHAEPADTYPRFFTAEHHRGITADLHRAVSEDSPTVNAIPVGSERSNHGPSPVGCREVYHYLVPLFDELAGSLATPEQRDVAAVFQFLAYAFADEALMPIRRMLAGHPNFLTDVQGVVAQLPFLFPHHPAAQAMADHWERAIAVNLKYHTRPDVPVWGARGGRWTENVACYVWGPIDLMVIHSHLLRFYFDGRNRLARPETTALAFWLLNTLSAPLERCEGRRTLPAQGAHAHGRQPARSLRVLGQELAHTDPLLAEYLLWAAPPSLEDRERPPAESYDYWTHLQSGTWYENAGTDPELKSEKFTGYGFVLRAQVGTPDEVTVYLQQIDDGPNYRWGRAGRGGNGVIYYYAAGRRYSHNGTEDVGDAATGDVERCTNFGVRKDPVGYKEIGPYRSVGINDLTEPLLDFGFAQFAQVNAAATATPEYRSRSIMLSGADYIVVFDDVRDSTPGRFSWFVDDDGRFPHITQLVPGAAGRSVGPQRPPEGYSYSHPWSWTKGRHYDGSGSFLTLISHRPEVSALPVEGGCLVRYPDREDRIFRSSETQEFSGGDGVAFSGTAGIVRRHDSAPYEAALFAGNRIAIPGICIETDGTVGISVTGMLTFSGTLSALQPGRITLISDASGYTFYIDSEPVETRRENTRVVIDVPAETHHWEWTSRPPTPARTRILHTVNGPGVFTLRWASAPGAISYDVQISHDSGDRWTSLVTGWRPTEYTVEGMPPGTKVHVRVISRGALQAARPSRPYPVYVTLDAPHHPDGLQLCRQASGIDVTWGEILGAAEYRLYRRIRPERDFTCIYSGTQQRHHDLTGPHSLVAEYRVTAVNDNGESTPCPAVDTDPAGTIDWDPRPDEVFRRVTESGEFYDDYDAEVEESMPIVAYPNPRRPRRSRND